jgi:putative membrane protein
MNRRDLLAGLSGAALLPLAAGGARAQPPTPNAPLTAIGADEYKSRTLMAGTLAKQASELALQKAANPKVKQFANLEVMEQTAMAQVLTLQANPPPARLDDKHAAVLKELQGASGAEFDKAYVKAQIEGHAELLTIQDAHTTARAQDTAAALAIDTARIATLAKPAIQTHLTMLKELTDVLRS